MRKEFKYFVGGIALCAVFIFCMFLLVANVYASESEPHEPEVIQSEEAEIVQLTGQESEQLELLEQDQEPVREEQIDFTATIPADQLEMLDNWAQELASSENETRIDLFASGVIIGELADLLQENVIENDCYTDESWQRYETAVAAGWDAISNFMIYTNDEVRAVIDELQASIAGLEYPAGKLPETGNGSSADNGLLSGLLAVIVFSSGLRAAT